MIKYTLIAALLLMAGLPVVGTADETVAPERVVYHLDDIANARWAMLLANAHLEQNAAAEIVIVAHGPGIRFLVEGATDRKGNPYGPGIFELAGKGVEFRACAATLEALDIPADQVVDEAQLVPSGAYEIARLQTREGYAYLKP
jgi:intracellular sulfur oxidation DsrE/DsrF family protein